MDNAMPKVSVIMNCYNSDKYLREAIDSVYAQTFDDWEIVFWDNASTDGSAGIAGSYSDKLRYFKACETTSLGAARNMAIQKARGEYIAFLDCDDIWLSEKLALQVAQLDKHPDSALGYGNYFRLYPDGKRALQFRSRQPEGPVFERFLYAYPVGLLTAIVRREALDRLSEMFDPSLYLWEQYDIFMRLLTRDKAIYCHTPLAVYRVHPGSGTVKRIFTKEYTDELDRILKKFYGMDPAFVAEHLGGLRHLGAKRQFIEAKIVLANGRPDEARRILKNTRWIDYKCVLLYLLTFLPKSLLPHLLKIRERYLLRF